jgi:hypothetical protein
MIFNYLDKLSGWLDRRFIIAYWSPVFLGGSMLIAVLVIHSGTAASLDAWKNLPSDAKLVLGGALLVGTTVLAYVLQALQDAIVRMYEGYSMWNWLAGLGVAAQQRHAGILLFQASRGPRSQTARYRHFLSFPQRSDDLRPTRLGNVLAAAERHPNYAYRMDGVLWWPRLYPLLSERFTERLEATLIPMLALLNMCTVALIVTVLGSAYLAWDDARTWLFMASLGSGLLFSTLLYNAAVSQAIGYGNLVRSAFDLYRHEILKQMGMFIPTNLQDELALWEVLSTWLYNQYVLPYDRETERDARGDPVFPGWVSSPFNYDGSIPGQPQPEPKPPEPKSIDVRLGFLS